MSELEIYGNKRATAGGFWFFLALLPLLSLPFAIGALTTIRAISNADGQSALVGMAMLGGFGWLFASLGAYWLQFRRIRRLDGPLLRLTEFGIEDAWKSPPCKLGWHEMSSAGWVSKGAGPILQFVPRQQRWIEKHVGSLGFRPFHYPALYLACSQEEISAFLSAHAPPDVLR